MNVIPKGPMPPHLSLALLQSGGIVRQRRDLFLSSPVSGIVRFDENDEESRMRRPSRKLRALRPCRGRGRLTR